MSAETAHSATTPDAVAVGDDSNGRRDPDRNQPTPATHVENGADARMGAPEEHARSGDELELRGDAERLTSSLKELMRVVQFRDRDRLCRYDVTVSQCYALSAVVAAGSLSVNELAAELFLEKSTASRLANSLEAKGYLEKVPDPSDGRSIRLEPTRQGATLALSIEAELIEENVALLRDFDPEVRHAMTRLVSRLTRGYTARVEAGGGSCCVV